MGLWYTRKARTYEDVYRLSVLSSELCCTYLGVPRRRSYLMEVHGNK